MYYCSEAREIEAKRNKGHLSKHIFSTSCVTTGVTAGWNMRASSAVSIYLDSVCCLDKLCVYEASVAVRQEVHLQ